MFTHSVYSIPYHKQIYNLSKKTTKNEWYSKLLSGWKATHFSVTVNERSNSQHWTTKMWLIKSQRIFFGVDVVWLSKGVFSCCAYKFGKHLWMINYLRSYIFWMLFAFIQWFTGSIVHRYSSKFYSDGINFDSSVVSSLSNSMRIKCK